MSAARLEREGGRNKKKELHAHTHVGINTPFVDQFYRGRKLMGAEFKPGGVVRVRPMGDEGAVAPRIFFKYPSLIVYLPTKALRINRYFSFLQLAE